MSDQARALYIDVYSDVICPWCYVGKRRLERALNGWNGSVPVKISWKPFQLNPAMPKSGMDRRQYLDAKFGGPEAAQSIYDHVAAAGTAERIPFAFDRIARTPNTFAAHRLIWLAGHQGKQDEMVEMLFRRYFVESSDIGNVETLAQAAADVGLDRTAIEAFLAGDEGGNEVQAEEAAGRRLGIRAVPYFVINGTSVLSGAQPPEEFLAAFREIEVGSVVGKAGA
ncbi:DsbA family oxidoreductase [Nitrospira sp. BLG_1]|uniref:DsbA family oxidoreductase n=1 Tax=Nitrospira sp. BLG_1 TaxID=3395883 RepID=UPI0039BC7FB5